MRNCLDASKGSSEISFELYRETDNRIYIPRYYGLTKFGIPKICKLKGGVDISVNFIGKLRETQIEPVQNFLDAAYNPLKMGGIISVPCGFGKNGLPIGLQMIGNHFDFLGQLCVLGVECAAVAVAAQVFARKKGGAADVANSAGLDLAAVGEVVV